MQPSALLGEVISAIAARLHVGAGIPVGHSAPGDVDNWIVTLASLLMLVAVGGVVARLAERLMRRSTPELVVLLNQSAAFYGRWPEDQHLSAPSGELIAEAARCQRIIELLERRAAADGDTGPAVRGPIDGLRTWITLLYKQIQVRSDAPSLTSYA